jgi:hypothetical protein
VAFAFLNNTGFTATNLSDTARDRASIITPAIDLAQRKADTLTQSRQAECLKRGPLCRDLEVREQDALTVLKSERDKIASDANPQAAKTAALIKWASFGLLAPSVDDIANLFLLLFALLPLCGGLIRMIARRR